jgi:hypothetical protein
MPSHNSTECNDRLKCRTGLKNPRLINPYLRTEMSRASQLRAPTSQGDYGMDVCVKSIFVHLRGAPLVKMVRGSERMNWQRSLLLC